jgi:hypothetical protein
MVFNRCIFSDITPASAKPSLKSDTQDLSGYQDISLLIMP